MTAADAAEYHAELHMDESSVAIEAGETLTERQMLEAMLTQSANDVAYSLAVWDAGSVAAFVVKMNALAASLGTTDTHYVDASGYDPQTGLVGIRRPADGQQSAWPSRPSPRWWP